jgi:hypothetical protein
MWRAGKTKEFLELVAHKTSVLVGYHKSPTRTPHTLSCVGLSSKKMKKKLERSEKKKKERMRKLRGMSEFL